MNYSMRWLGVDVEFQGSCLHILHLGLLSPRLNVCTMVRMLFFNDPSILLLVPVVTQQPRGCECRHLPNVKPVIVSDAVHILLNAVLCFRRYWPTCYRFQHT